MTKHVQPPGLHQRAVDDLIREGALQWLVRYLADIPALEAEALRRASFWGSPLDLDQLLFGAVGASADPGGKRVRDVLTV